MTHMLGYISMLIRHKHEE